MSTRSLRVRRERGAVAIIVALCMVVIMTSAALGVDIAKLVYARQSLRSALDAAAQASSYSLPDVADARAQAKTYFKANFGKDLANSNIAFHCVVASTGAAKTPNATQVAASCPAAKPNVSLAKCNTLICAIPCPEATSSRCNTITVSYAAVVDYSFGPAIGIPTGNTGTITSAACRGACGSGSPNPMNVVLMADRTTSMTESDVTKMKTGIYNMLGIMTPSLQYVSFGTIHKSSSTTIGGSSTSSCLTGPPTTTNAFSQAESDWGSTWNASKNTGYASGNLNFNGTWVPQRFANDYLKADKTLNTSSSLYYQINCMTRSSGTAVGAPGGWGTHLASAMKGATRYLLGHDANNISTLDSSGARTDMGTPRKVIVFETDGRPDEVFTSNSGNLTIASSNKYDIGAYQDGEKGCENFLSIANAAKAAGITVITIGYGDANEMTCARKYQSNDGVADNKGTKMVRSYLAAASGDAGSTAVATATDCSTSAGALSENSDGDNYYCAPNPDDLAAVFVSALGTVTGNTKLISIEGFSD